MTAAETDLALAHCLADTADAIALRHFAAGDTTWRAKSDGSPVSAADEEIEHALRTRIQAERPGDGILGEEFGATGHSRRRWIIDAIDGTASFLAGEPEWSTLIALEEHGRIILGLVTAPALRRRWWARRGTGAWTRSTTTATAATTATAEPGNATATAATATATATAEPRNAVPGNAVPGNAVPGSAEPGTAEPLVITGAETLAEASVGIWPAPPRLSPEHTALAAAVAAVARATRPAVNWDDPTPLREPVRKPSTGTGTCHGALLVATGQLDAFLLLGAGPWDIAPLVPIIEEAGGTYTDLTTPPATETVSALFTNHALRMQILNATSDRI